MAKRATVSANLLPSRADDDGLITHAIPAFFAPVILELGDKAIAVDGQEMFWIVNLALDPEYVKARQALFQERFLAYVIASIRLPH